MNSAVRFLTSLAQAFSAMALYSEGHAARDRALHEAWEFLQILLRELPEANFLFLEDSVVFDGRPLREFRNSPLARRLWENGVQRIEFTGGVDRNELSGFLKDITARIGSAVAAPPAAPTGYTHIRFGAVSTGEDVEKQSSQFNLDKSLERVQSLEEDAMLKGRISPNLARSVVSTLTSAMRYGKRMLVPLVPLKQVDQYSTVHSMNTSVLSMALGEFLHLGPGNVRQIGESALLHDVGKVAVPLDILNKPSKLEPDEWEVVKRHPVEGARILMRSGGLDLAAIAAYEHHLRWDGGGYPELNYERKPHPVSQFVHICDVYDAMRTLRPFQAPIPSDEILTHLESQAGKDFNPHLVKAFVGMIRKWSARIIVANGEEEIETTG